ncbi:hypothetical protein PVAP13_5KG064987 [Panicum virgatum]|uniref:Uncharacterized protein n=1 Tax=Panicum virgatum TaxID=38727 RepID=A0A8T0SAQ9_PANVG|nr:hypothetical protein PVAP13_5KG064987 [Panicum virgatum]
MCTPNQVRMPAQEDRPAVALLLAKPRATAHLQPQSGDLLAAGTTGVVTAGNGRDRRRWAARCRHGVGGHRSKAKGLPGTTEVNGGQHRIQLGTAGGARIRPTSARIQPPQEQIWPRKEARRGWEKKEERDRE